MIRQEWSPQCTAGPGSPTQSVVRGSKRPWHAPPWLQRLQRPEGKPGRGESTPKNINPHLSASPLLGLGGPGAPEGGSLGKSPSASLSFRGSIWTTTGWQRWQTSLSLSSIGWSFLEQGTEKDSKVTVAPVVKIAVVH